MAKAKRMDGGNTIRDRIERETDAAMAELEKRVKAQLKDLPEGDTPPEVPERMIVRAAIRARVMREVRAAVRDQVLEVPEP